MSATRLHRIAVLALLALLPACQNPNQEMRQIDADYAGGNYRAAYQRATSLSRTTDPATAERAAYMAGLAAVKLKQYGKAESHLVHAAQSPDKALRADALVQLGLVYEHQQRDRAALRAMLAAAELLEGEEKANAYFHAAIAEQRLGQWPDARTHLSLARSHSKDPAFDQRVSEQLAVTGFTLQAGVYAEQNNAQRAAQTVAAKAQELRLGAPRLVPATAADGRLLTRVQVGQFSTYAGAARAREQIGSEQWLIVPLTER